MDPAEQKLLDVNYLEVAFSPAYQVDDDILAQIGAFDLGDNIGEPRQIQDDGYTSNYSIS
jgi:hypothetical protein